MTIANMISICICEIYVTNQLAMAKHSYIAHDEQYEIRKT